MTLAQITREYNPRGSALTVFKNRSPELLVSGPAGTGKSRACLEKIHAMCLLNANLRVLIVRKTAASLSSTGLETYRKFVAAEALTAGHVIFHGGSPQHPAQYRYVNGSTITVGGMDRATKIMSSEYDLIYVQEATELTEDDWEALTTRLRNWSISFQQLLADCNPDRPTHWLKKRVERGVCKMLESRHEDNPTLFDDDGKLTERGAIYISKLDNLTGVRYQRLRLGRWTAAEGVIYEGWDSALHLIDRFEIPKEWPRYWSIDFGFTNPFVWQAWAEDPDGRLFMYREIYHTQRLVEDHARQIMQVTANEPRPVYVVCDHDAEGRATLEKHVKLQTIAAKKKVKEGIEAVQSRLRRADDGKPRLFILRDSTVERDASLADAGKPASTAEEIPGYVWDKLKEAPVKEDDHGCDAKRYIVMARREGGIPRMRWL